MKFVKKSKRCTPKVSLILLDWEVRESFHTCHYLSKQTLPRNQFEIVVVEYYSKVSKAIETVKDHIDTWCILEMSHDHCYHKHLMYNVGFLLSKGEHIIICDSDAMVKPTFLESIVTFFEQNPNSLLHLDQVRNHNRAYFPFNYPTFEQVTGHGCINFSNGVTRGITATEDLIHSRNYGACFCCKRKDFIAAGGADEHIDYTGHICGPYDLTYRLLNLGLTEQWLKNEFLYHTWHPGSDGHGNYMGPHDGYNLSTTAFEAIMTGRVQPHVTNPLIKKLQEGSTPSLEEIENKALSSNIKEATSIKTLRRKKTTQKIAKKSYSQIMKDNYIIKKTPKQFDVYPLSLDKSSFPCFSSKSLKGAENFVKKHSTYRWKRFFFIIFYQFPLHFLTRTMRPVKKLSFFSVFRPVNLVAFSNILSWKAYRKIKKSSSNPIVYTCSQREFYTLQEIIRLRQQIKSLAKQFLGIQAKKVRVCLLDLEELARLEKKGADVPLFVTEKTLKFICSHDTLKTRTITTI